jgi:multiple sugar transport system permease protein
MLEGEQYFMRQNRKPHIIGIIFVMPWILGFLIFQLYPILASLYYSLCEYSILRPPDFIGIDNYVQLFADEKFYLAIYNTLYICLISVPLNLVFSLLMALLLSLEVKGQHIYRTIFYIPSVVSVVASSVVWLWILNPEYGILNTALGYLGLPQPVWLADPVFTKPSLVMMGLWGSGGTMIIYLSAIKGVPQSLYEAADLDGAGAWRKFRNITIPAISTATLFQLITGLISGFQYFTQAFVLIGGSNNISAGGPQNSLLFYALYLYHQGFKWLKMGTASAMAWILFLLTALVTFVVFKTSLKWVYHETE